MSNQLISLRNGVKIPTIGFGTWQLKGTSCYNSVVEAIKIGFQLVDTASVYGNEEYVGNAIRDAIKLDESKQNQSVEFETANQQNIFVTTKVFPDSFGFENAYNSVKNSLNKLNFDKIDLVLLHWPGSRKTPDDEALCRKERSETWKAMEKLYKEGYVRAIGVSNYYPRHLNQLIDDGVEIVPMLDQVEMHPFLDLAELDEWAAKHSMVMQAYSSLGIGSGELINHPIVQQVAKECNCSAGQALLRYGMQKGYLVLPRTSKLERVKENFDALNVKLSDEHMQKLKALNQNKHFCWDPSNVC